MKKMFYSFVAFAAIAMTVASCSSDIENNNNPAAGEKVTMTFSATQETAGATSRTAIDATDATKVNWLNTDAITVWDGTAKNAFTVAPKSDATTADITGSVTKGATTFTAVYPNSVGQSCTFTAEGITDLVIPATQTATEDTYDPVAAVMTAATTGNNLEFKQVCSFLKITTASEYTKIVVSVATGNIAGTFSVVPSTGVSTVTEGLTTITVNPANPATKISVGTYYIAIAPGEVKGFNVKCYTDASNYVEKTKTGTITFNRAAIVYLGVTSAEKGWVAPDPNLLIGEFSVSAKKKVRFTKSNLYWDGSSFKFEENQTDYPTSWGDNHVGHFCWTKTAAASYAKSYSDGTCTTSDVPFFAESQGGLTVEGTSGLYALTFDEWSFLIYYRTNATNLRKYGQTVGEKTNCLLIAPDGFDTSKWHSSNSYTLEEVNSLGLVCLPAAGYRNGSSFENDGSHGGYWSATPYSYGSGSAFYLYFYSDDVIVENYGNRYIGLSLRLVK